MIVASSSQRESNNSYNVRLTRHQYIIIYNPSIEVLYKL